MKERMLIAMAMLFAVEVSAQALKAGFTAEEASVVYYEQGFDSPEELSEWTLKTTNESSTWHLAERPYVNGLPAFTVFDPESRYSLAIRYDDYNAQDETVTSPPIEIEEGSRCRFYSCFSGIFLYYGSWSLIVTDVATSTQTEILNAFKWAQEVGYEGPNWMPWDLDLSAFAGKTVAFSFNYKGKGGEDVLIDGFRIVRNDPSASQSVTVNEGDAVHFQDASEGNPVSWSWEFEGGTPSVSTEQNPVVVYESAGTYRVKLTVGDGTTSDECERATFVEVKCVAPTAKIGMPENGYLSPWVACFIPLGVPVQFRDLSEGKPTSWEWQLQGSDQEKSEEQNPIATYSKKGLYSLSLRASNDAGVATDILQYALQAGGEQYVWNIAPEENDGLEAITLGWYGYYGGTNWLGMKAFAERFSAPLAPAEISEVAVYFASVAAPVSPNMPITVSINAVGDDGMPGEMLASSTLKSSELNQDVAFKETVFGFDEPVPVEDAFFVVIGGFPNGADDKGTDDIAMYSVRRETGGKSTVYHLLEEQDDYGNPVLGGTDQWYASGDEAVSFAIAPLLSYGDGEDEGSEKSVVGKHDGLRAFVADGVLRIVQPTEYERLEVYNAAGMSVYATENSVCEVSLDGYADGLFVVAIRQKDGRVRTAKVWKR